MPEIIKIDKRTVFNYIHGVSFINKLGAWMRDNRKDVSDYHWDWKTADKNTTHFIVEVVSYNNERNSNV